MPRIRHHDAHVRARNALLRRIVQRMIEWGVLGRDPKLKGADWVVVEAVLMHRAEKKLTIFSQSGGWYPGWGAVKGRPAVFLRKTTDVSADMIHNIMCVEIDNEKANSG